MEKEKKLKKATWDIFISHASSDKATADSLVDMLEARGVNCWIAPRNIRPGQDYGEAILRGIEESVMFVLVFSASADASKHVLREVDRAIGFDKVIVPIKFDMSLPTGGMNYRLCTVQWVNSSKVPIPEKTILDTLTVLEAAKKREFVENNQTPECILLNVCSRCGAQYAEHDPSGCSFHSQPPQNIGNTGPERDYAEIWQFPCCGQKYVGTFTEIGLSISDAAPPKSPGCVKGRHTPKYSFRR